MAAEAYTIRYMITGEDGEVIPRNATHVSVHPSVKVIPLELFYNHQNIIELICHDGVIRIKFNAFSACPRLKRVIMKGVEEVKAEVFKYCKALEYVECDKLEIIGAYAFFKCESITNINLPSAKIVREAAFYTCRALVDAKFGNKLESIEGDVFYGCRSLQRITIPLRNGLFDCNNTFHCCENLRHVDLVDEVALPHTIDALLWEEWKNDLNAKVASIAQIFPNACAGNYNNDGEKAIVIRQWIADVLNKIIYYKSRHRRLLKEAESRLQLALPHDIVINSVASFLMLPHHTFDGEDEAEAEHICIDVSIDERYSFKVDSFEEEDNHRDSEGEGKAQLAATPTGEEGTNDTKRRKRERTQNNGNDVDGGNLAHFPSLSSLECDLGNMDERYWLP